MIGEYYIQRLQRWQRGFHVPNFHDSRFGFIILAMRLKPRYEAVFKFGTSDTASGVVSVYVNTGENIF